MELYSGLIFYADLSDQVDSIAEFWKIINVIDC